MSLLPIAELARLVESGVVDQGFALLYGEGEVAVARRRYLRLIERGLERFGNRPACLVSAPGRTELGGNHTDHQGGRVLAAAIDQDCVGLVATSDEASIKVISDLLPHGLTVELNQRQPVAAERGLAAALVRGAAVKVAEMAGFALSPFQAVVHATCRPGTGLSSSAAFSIFVAASSQFVATGTLVDPVVAARAAKYAENDFFGKPCGLMDQLASSCGGVLAIDFQKPDQPEIRHLAADLNGHGYRLVIVDTGGSHADLTPDYSAIGQEMQMAATALGASRGREVALEQVLAELAKIRQLAGDRAVLRLLHFLEEDQRVVRQITALDEKRFTDFLELVRLSGQSSMGLLQNCSSPANSREQGILLGLALAKRACPEAVCRVHGGGFAGTIQCYVPETSVTAFLVEMQRCFGHASSWQVRPGRPGFCVLGAGGWQFPAVEV